jgi:hypothetical protein
MLLLFASSLSDAASCGLLQNKTCANRFSAHGGTSGRIRTEIYGFDLKLCFFNKIP